MEQIDMVHTDVSRGIAIGMGLAGILMITLGFVAMMAYDEGWEAGASLCQQAPQLPQCKAVVK